MTRSLSPYRESATEPAASERPSITRPSTLLRRPSRVPLGLVLMVAIASVHEGYGGGPEAIRGRMIVWGITGIAWLCFLVAAVTGRSIERDEARTNVVQQAWYWLIGTEVTLFMLASLVFGTERIAWTVLGWVLAALAGATALSRSGSSPRRVTHDRQ